MLGTIRSSCTINDWLLVVLLPHSDTGMDVPLRRPSPRRDNLTGEKRESIRNSGESVRTCDEDLEKHVAADSWVSTALNQTSRVLLEGAFTLCKFII